jgi:2-methylisocitrate lyase-like PEP mutase family enzyme
MTDRQQQKEKAIAFRRLHQREETLLLPNVWDVASARIFEEAGFLALATTSAGIAFSLGYPDGQRISPLEMLARIGRIARAVRVPVTADVEAGYGERPEDAARTALAVIEAGAVGMNLEDGTGDPEHPLVELGLQVEKIRAVKEAVVNTGVPLFLNARTDVYLDNVGAPETRYDETVKRLIAYRDAGGDSLFVPGVKDPEIICRIVKDVRCPVNILAGPGFPSVKELHAMGVRRVSLGSAPMRATLGLVQRMAKELREQGTYAALEGGIAHAAMNKMMERNAGG